MALAVGIWHECLIVDPGIGFGKAPTVSLTLLRHLGSLPARSMLEGIPRLAGTSRKGFISRVLALPIGKCLEGTLATLALLVAQGADSVRVQDVRAAARCCRMADAIVRGAG